MYTIFLIVDHDFLNSAVAVNVKCIVQILFGHINVAQRLWYVLFRVCDRHVCAAVNMALEQLAEIKVDSNVCICHNDIFFLLALEIVDNARNRLNPAIVDIYGFLRKRRNDIQTTLLARQIPLSTRSQMIHQRMIISLYNQ